MRKENISNTIILGFAIYGLIQLIILGNQYIPVFLEG
jgi:hypothetical protein